MQEDTQGIQEEKTEPESVKFPYSLEIVGEASPESKAKEISRITTGKMRLSGDLVLEKGECRVSVPLAGENKAVFRWSETDAIQSLMNPARDEANLRKAKRVTLIVEESTIKIAPIHSWNNDLAKKYGITGR